MAGCRSWKVCVLLCVVTTVPAVGCANHTRTGALVGTGIGTAAGAVIGHQIGKGKEGAALGAVIGAGSGALAGRAQDNQEQRDAAYSYAAQTQATQRAHERAMTNRDVMDLSQRQFSDSFIITQIQDRGGLFDTTTSGLITLQQGGVSEVVMKAMSDYNLQR